MLADEALGDLADRFRRFASEAGRDSPLYARLSAGAANDSVAIQLLATAHDEQQRRPNLLFAAVHDLLLDGLVHPLAMYYPSLGGTRPPDQHAVDLLTEFLREHRRALTARITRRATQTNEVGRCAALWPALCTTVGTQGHPVTLVELGSSAGLLLHLDRYSYRISGVTHDTARNDSPVTVSTRAVGETPPPTCSDVRITRRIGIDQSPLDPHNADDARWLAACVWPEHTTRLQQLRAAIEVARNHDDVDIRPGDLVAHLPGVLDDVDPAASLVVMHSATLAYLTASSRKQVDAVLAAVGATRDVTVISFEGTFTEPLLSLDRRHGEPAPAGERFLLGATIWIRGVGHDRLLARAHPHGRWIQWAA